MPAMSGERCHGNGVVQGGGRAANRTQQIRTCLGGSRWPGMSERPPAASTGSLLGGFAIPPARQRLHPWHEGGRASTWGRNRHCLHAGCLATVATAMAGRDITAIQQLLVPTHCREGHPYGRPQQSHGQTGRIPPGPGTAAPPMCPHVGGPYRHRNRIPENLNGAMNTTAPLWVCSPTTRYMEHTAQGRAYKGGGK